MELHTGRRPPGGGSVQDNFMEDEEDMEPNIITNNGLSQKCLLK